MSLNSNNSPFISFIRNDIKYVIIREPTQEYIINSENITDSVQNLKYYFQIENQIIKLKVCEDVLKRLDTYLGIVLNNSNLKIEDRNIVITELYRWLRNCATIESSQNFICFQTNILETTKNIVNCLQKNDLSLKIIIQFLINLVTLNRIVTQKVHKEFFDLILNLITEEVYIYECSALIYNISLFIPLEINTIETIFKLCNETNQNEFVLFFIEYCISCNEFWDNYDKLNTSDKLIALETFRSKQIQDKKYNLPQSGINNIISSYLKSPDIFFKINNATIYEEVHEVSILLEILSSLSSKDEYIKILQENKDILVTSSALLINFHKLGKNGDTLFTPVQKLSECGPEDLNNPVFGLKADLIRLIGNMCWKNTTMQNLAREAEVIPVILDCCNIDVKNPFILQWCIFAIRNVCENNEENQKMISGLHREGTVSSQVLTEFGITLNNDGDGSLKIVSLDSLKI